MLSRNAESNELPAQDALPPRPRWRRRFFSHGLLYPLGQTGRWRGLRRIMPQQIFDRLELTDGLLAVSHLMR